MKPRPHGARPVAAAGMTAEPAEPGSSERWRGLGLALATCAATTALTHLLVPFFDLANITMVFLLSVVGVAVWLGRAPAVLAAVVNVVAFDFFSVPPRILFAVSDAQ